MAFLSQTGLRLDPVLNHNFLISLIDSSSNLGSLVSTVVFDVLAGGFMECSGIEMSMQPEEYKEGGNNGSALKFPSRVSWTNLTLKKGIAASTSFWDWHYGFVEGKGKRRDGVIILQSDLHVPNNIWSFRRGLPVKYTGPAMNANQNSVAIEAIEIAHEGIYQVPFVGLGSAGVSAIAKLGV
jgi:phage tail-like protein